MRCDHQANEGIALSVPVLFALNPVSSESERRPSRVPAKQVLTSLVFRLCYPR
jgi:hypothetical protein